MFWPRRNAAGGTLASQPLTKSCDAVLCMSFWPLVGAGATGLAKIRVRLYRAHFRRKDGKYLIDTGLPSKLGHSSAYRAAERTTGTDAEEIERGPAEDVRDVRQVLQSIAGTGIQGVEGTGYGGGPGVDAGQSVATFKEQLVGPAVQVRINRRRAGRSPG